VLSFSRSARPLRHESLEARTNRFRDGQVLPFSIIIYTVPEATERRVSPR
jgi:hypothetical protein